MSLRHIKTADDSTEAVPSREDKLDQWSPAQLALKQDKESSPAKGKAPTTGWNPAEVWRRRIKR
jgi:hypothetical protein